MEAFEDTLIGQLKKIDENISGEADKLRHLAGNLTFEQVLEFSLGDSIPDVPSFQLHRKGVYFFEIKNKDLSLDVISWFDAFTTIWEDTDVTWVPGIKKKRKIAHTKFNDWIPLYIGKSKNIGGRIFEHIHQEKNKTTFSMKLKARANMHGEILKISWIPLDVTNYDMIAPSIETMLRDRLNPIVGKQ